MYFNQYLVFSSLLNVVVCVKNDQHNITFYLVYDMLELKERFFPYVTPT